MKNNDENKKKRKKISFYLIFCAFTLICSIAYLTYSALIVDSIVNNILKLSIPLFIFIISLILFLSASKSSMKNWLILSTAIILILFMGFNLLTNLNIINLPSDEKMISYANKSYKTLSEWADKNNITLDVEYEYSDTIEKGNIIRTDIFEGTLVKEISTIIVTISEGPDYDKIVVVPSMIGWDIEEVTEFIENNFMENVTIEYEMSDELRDTVIEQSKNGDIRRNQEWTLTVSLGTEEELSQTVAMEDLEGLTLFRATLWLKRNGINYSLEYEFSDDIERNIVISQSIDNGEIVSISEDTIVLTISKGKAIVVPDILNMTVDEITNWIVDNKLKVEFDEIYDESIEVGKIISASIEKGDQIEVETLVTVTISKGQIKMLSFNSLSEFKTWANKYSILYNLSYSYSTSISKGSVISYSYAEGDIVDPESIIYVNVSLGPAITIPSFTGKTKTEATTLCNSLGIRCSFSTGTYTSYAENVVYSQSRSSGSKVASGTAITLTLSKGIPVTKTLYIQQNWLSIGNADATITSLRTQFANNYPGVNFNFTKVKDNTLSSGMISQSSPTNHGSSVTQGQTYTIYIVSN
ncbi:MAG TPA: PASTA domain-containing protein [Bacilli bacterium]|nr:PASTA domain-containing protein [Bacilli bacterium]